MGILTRDITMSILYVFTFLAPCYGVRDDFYLIIMLGSPT
jgi:hypothetical protein